MSNHLGLANECCGGGDCPVVGSFGRGMNHDDRLDAPHDERSQAVVAFVEGWVEQFIVEDETVLIDLEDAKLTNFRPLDLIFYKRSRQAAL